MATWKFPSRVCGPVKGKDQRCRTLSDVPVHVFGAVPSRLPEAGLVFRVGLSCPLILFGKLFLVDLPVHGAADLALRPQVGLWPRRVRLFGLSLLLRDVLLFARVLLSGLYALELLFQRAGTVEGRLVVGEVNALGVGRGTSLGCVAHNSCEFYHARP
jgi:hypothetical protein